MKMKICFVSLTMQSSVLLLPAAGSCSHGTRCENPVHNISTAPNSRGGQSRAFSIKSQIFSQELVKTKAKRA